MINQTLALVVRARDRVTKGRVVQLFRADLQGEMLLPAVKAQQTATGEAYHGVKAIVHAAEARHFLLLHGRGLCAAVQLGADDAGQGHGHDLVLFRDLAVVGVLRTAALEEELGLFVARALGALAKVVLRIFVGGWGG